MTSLGVPFLDLRAQYLSIRDEIHAAIQAVIDESAFVRGRFVREFEQAFARVQDVRHCVGVANGTDALAIALRALDIGAGDEVITAANSWVASVEAVTVAGAEAVLVDVEREYYNLDPEQIKAKITDRTRAVIPVHLYGQPASMGAIVDVARRHGIAIVEDCAQAHLSEVDGRKVGSFGRASGFSFYPGKNLGAYGDAGCITTDDDDVARFARMYANHGSSPSDKHRHQFQGVNSRLDGIQAAVLLAKLPHLERWNKERRAKAALYDRALDGIGDVAPPRVRPGSEHVYHVYCIRTVHRDALRTHLTRRGVGTSIHYPVAIPFLGAFADRGYTKEDFPVAWQHQDEILSLPIYPELTEGSIDYVVASIRQFFDDRRRLQ